MRAHVASIHLLFILFLLGVATVDARGGGRGGGRSSSGGSRARSYSSSSSSSTSSSSSRNYSSNKQSSSYSAVGQSSRGTYYVYNGRNKNDCDKYDENSNYYKKYCSDDNSGHTYTYAGLGGGAAIASAIALTIIKRRRQRKLVIQTDSGNEKLTKTMVSDV